MIFTGFVCDKGHKKDHSAKHLDREISQTTGWIFMIPKPFENALAALF